MEKMGKIGMSCLLDVMRLPKTSRWCVRAGDHRGNTATGLCKAPHDDTPRCRAGGGCLMSNVRRLPGPIADLWDWQRLGLCRGRDSTQFFHPDGERGSSRNRREAKAK